MTIDMTQFYQVFFEECDELLAEAERLLMALDIDNPESEDLNAIFRAAHSIKGGAATFGMTDMTEITHVLESLLDKIRKNEMALTAEHVEAFLSAKDILQMQVDAHRANDMDSVDADAVNSVRATLQALSLKGDGTPVAKPVEAAPVVSATPVATPIIEVPEGNKLFHIGLPAMPEKDVTNLEAELGLLGTASLHKDAAG
ncbi:MAG: Hpt domain-containing protein, partial [Methylophilaceae bacterium]|nr:Hpt domain-containing protein [Methyloradius sp.]